MIRMTLIATIALALGGCTQTIYVRDEQVVLNQAPQVILSQEPPVIITDGELYQFQVIPEPCASYGC